MSKFKGKTAIISGGAEGIGLSVAKALGEQGMNIVLTDINQQNLENAAKELEESGVPVLTARLDVADEEQWKHIAEKASERFGKLHMVVNNAGVGGDSVSVENQEKKGWQWTLDVNLMGVVYGAKTIVPFIKSHDEGGWIVNVASMAGMGGFLHGGAYNATKAAVVALSESWYEELSSQNINVSVLCPAFVKTRIYDSERNRPEQYKSEISSSESNNSFLKKTKKMIENGIEVSIVGKRVVEALNNGEFYIFTHPGYRSEIQERFKAIDEAFKDSEKSIALKEVPNQ